MAIDKILSAIHSPLSADKLISTTIIALNKAEIVHTGSETFNSSAGSFLTACLKNWGYQFMYEAGLHKLVPRALLPPSSPPWEIPKHNKIIERFAPKHLLIKPSMQEKLKPVLDFATVLKKNSFVKVKVSPNKHPPVPNKIPKLQLITLTQNPPKRKKEKFSLL
jgi:hypothetical protein